MLQYLRNSLHAWVVDFWLAVSLQRVAQQREFAYRAGVLSRQLRDENAKLSNLLLQTEADRRAMRDSVLDHMDYEEALRNEISSLKRHLGMAIDERDRARTVAKVKK